MTTCTQVARGYLSDGEMKAFYRKKAREFEALHKYKEAEKAYLQVSSGDRSSGTCTRRRLWATWCCL
jgi:hypothetical protein